MGWLSKEPSDSTRPGAGRDALQARYMSGESRAHNAAQQRDDAAVIDLIGSTEPRSLVAGREDAMGRASDCARRVVWGGCKEPSSHVIQLECDV